MRSDTNLSAPERALRRKRDRDAEADHRESGLRVREARESIERGKRGADERPDERGADEARSDVRGVGHHKAGLRRERGEQRFIGLHVPRVKLRSPGERAAGCASRGQRIALISETRGEGR